LHVYHAVKEREGNKYGMACNCEKKKRDIGPFRDTGVELTSPATEQKPSSEEEKPTVPEPPKEMPKRMVKFL
jgi:hypothetical protein